MSNIKDKLWENALDELFDGTIESLIDNFFIKDQYYWLIKQLEEETFDWEKIFTLDNHGKVILSEYYIKKIKELLKEKEWTVLIFCEKLKEWLKKENINIHPVRILEITGKLYGGTWDELFLRTEPELVAIVKDIIDICLCKALESRELRNDVTDIVFGPEENEEEKVLRSFLFRDRHNSFFLYMNMAMSWAKYVLPTSRQNKEWLAETMEKFTESLISGKRVMPGYEIIYLVKITKYLLKPNDFEKIRELVAKERCLVLTDEDCEIRNLINMFMSNIVFARECREMEFQTFKEMVQRIM